MMLLRPARLLHPLVALVVSGCASGDPKIPGINMGAPEVTWASKNREQRFGFMGARVHPVMRDVFAKYDDSYESDFRCETCHGENMELVDYKMPADIYPLPPEDTVKQSKEYDEEVTQFMVKDVMPATQELFNQGHGKPTKVSCFTCHPRE